MPRSGTTWLGKIFDSHPETLYRHEPDSFGRLNFMPMVPDPAQASRWRDGIEAFIAALPRMRDTKVAATLPTFPKAYLSPSAQRWNAMATRIAKLQARARGEATARLITPANGHARVVWKSIESVGRLPVLLTLLAYARAALIIRHPCGFLASVVRGKHQRRFTDTDSIGEDLTLLDILCETPVAAEYELDSQRLRAMTPVQRLTWQWVLCNESALRACPHPRLMPITYEGLCAAPLETTTALFRHSGLALAEETRAFVEASTTIHHDRYYSVFKHPAQAATAWHHELPEETQRAVARVAANTRAGAMFDDLRARETAC